MFVCAGSRHRHCADDHYVGARTCDRFQQTVYVAGHLDYDQETGEAESRRVQLPQSTVERDLGEQENGFYLQNISQIKIFISAFTNQTLQFISSP